MKWWRPWHRDRETSSEKRADALLRRVREQQAEVDRITSQLKERQRGNNFSQMFEQGLKGNYD
jgi:hypothetical protein